MGAAGAPLSASADAHTPADAASTTPAPHKHPGGRPPGSRNKTTGAAKAAKLAAHPGREQLVRAVAAGEMTQTAAARQLGCTPKTVSTWVAKFHSEQPKPAAPVASEHKRPEEITTPDRPRGPIGETEAQRTARLAIKAARQRERDAERRQLRRWAWSQPSRSPTRQGQLAAISKNLAAAAGAIGGIVAER